MVRMRLGGIVRMVLFGFLVPGVAAQMSRQSPPSPERGTEQSPRSSQAKPQVELRRFSLLSGASIDVSSDWIEREQMPPPRDCLDGGSEAYKKAKRQAELPDQTTISPDLSVRADCKHPPTLAGFYSSQLSPGVLFRVTNGVELAGGIYPEFYLTPMEKVEANGLTFYVFEAQGRMQLDLATVNHFNLPDEMQGAQVDFFWAVGAPSPFPFLRDPQRKNVPLIQVAFAGIGLGPAKRDIFLRLLRQVHSP